MDESKIVKVCVDQIGLELIIRAVDKDNFNVTDGRFSVDNEQILGLYGSEYVSLNLFDLYDIDRYPKNISIIYSGNNYYDANTTYLVDLNNTIIANDVYGQNTFNITILDNAKNPIMGYVSLNILSDKDPIYISKQSDKNGFINLDLALEPGNYKVYISNSETGQRSNYWWNVTKKQEKQRYKN